MALKGDRHEFETDIGYFCNDVVSRGTVLVFGSTGSGASLDDTNAVVAFGGSGLSVNLKPAGLLLNDMVSVDLTKYHLNFYKNVMPVGGKCTLLKKGWVVTDQIVSGITPVAGDGAYLGPYGRLTNVSTNAPKCGTFLSAKDQSGFAKVEINLP